MNAKTAIIFQLIFGTGGYGLIWYGSSWMVALGIFLALFANNIGHSRNVDIIEQSQQ